ncbi:MAG: flagellar basal body L-ring protein FlgH [bacterium]
MTNVKCQMSNGGIAARYKIIILFLNLSFVICHLSLFAAQADSIWNSDSASPYSTQKAYKVGDIINIIIVENSSAKNLANTKTNVSDDLSAKLTHTIQRLAPIIGTNNSIAGNVSNKYSGDGSTSQGSNVTSRISAWVTDVFPNGNLEIKGQHKVKVNNETHEIILTGIVRPKDISGANTIFSYQVANADLAVKGSGAVADASSPGWITRIFNWIF